MIASAAYRRFVPTDPVENLRFRLSLHDECMRSERARALVTRACAEDPVFFVNAFGWQTNPDNFDEEDGPFVCFPFQEEAIDKTIYWLFEDRRRLVVWEKSRKQGGTFLALFLSAWLTLFKRRKRVLAMSHNEKAVERAGDEDTLFGKTDYILGRLPSWMQDGLPRLKGVYQMRKVKSQIVGTSTTVRTGVGGRVHVILGDEFSKYNNAEAILHQLRHTGPFLVVGTHYGVGGTWYDLCNRPDVAKVVFHWSMNPMFNRGLYRSAPDLPNHRRVVDPALYGPLPPDYPFVADGSPHGGPFPGIRSVWYDAMCRDSTSREVAISLDIDPSGAARQFFNVHMLRNYIRDYAREPEWVGEIEYDPAGRPRRLIERDGGPLRLWRKPLGVGERTGRWFAPGLYKAGCDVSAGTGATPSCIAAGDALTGEKILEWQYALPPHAEPQNFAKVAVALCNMLLAPDGGPAQLIWDRTGAVGEKFGQAVQELPFRNFWYWRDEFTLKPRVSDIPGWYANNKSTLALFNDYNEALDKGLVTNPSESALKECLAFEYVVGGNAIAHGASVRTDDPSAGRVNHSDMAYADALMWKLMKEAGGAKKPEERLGKTAAGDYGWNADGPSIGWLLAQGNGHRKDPFRR